MDGPSRSRHSELCAEMQQSTVLLDMHIGAGYILSYAISAGYEAGYKALLREAAHGKSNHVEVPS